MITFLDGPAQTVKGLCLRRAPIFLRVVCVSGTNQWDGLDQVSDKPAVDEVIYVYRLVENRGICCIRRARGGGCFPMATYRIVDPQPADADMRSNDRWQKWAYEQAGKEEAPQGG